MTLPELCGAAAVVCILGACASASAGSADGLDVDALERLYEARTDSARMRFSEADVAFVSGMIAHHGQAIDMSELAPARAASESVRTLAARIINAQRDEIAWMERWLRERGQPLPAPGAMDHTGHLPGMLTPAEIDALGRSSGADFDRLFLDSMIRHHEGALAMVETLLASEEAVQDPATFKLASDIHVDQSTEIARMHRMLDTLNRGDAR
ncbi:MAG: DUF305 domain-containing protein [Gemmatimonadales bacterium]